MQHQIITKWLGLSVVILAGLYSGLCCLYVATHNYYPPLLRVLFPLLWLILVVVAIRKVPVKR